MGDLCFYPRCRVNNERKQPKRPVSNNPHLYQHDLCSLCMRGQFLFLLSFCKLLLYVCSVVCHCGTICCIFGDLGYTFTDFCSCGGDLGCTFAYLSRFGDHLGGAWGHRSRTLADIVGFGVHLVRTSGSLGCPFGDLSGLWHLLGYTCGKVGNTFADLLGFWV